MNQSESPFTTQSPKEMSRRPFPSLPRAPASPLHCQDPSFPCCQPHFLQTSILPHLTPRPSLPRIIRSALWLPLGRELGLKLSKFTCTAQAHTRAHAHTNTTHMCTRRTGESLLQPAPLQLDLPLNLSFTCAVPRSATG